MSQQIIAISWSHYQTPLNFRDKLSLSRNEIKQCIPLILSEDQILELAVLSTCNRIEFYALADSSVEILLSINNLYSNILKRNFPRHQSAPEIYTGVDAVQHICRVAAGMESMVLGESQILTQVQAALQILNRSQPDAYVLNQLFNDALHSAETIRDETPFFSGPTSISELAVITAGQIYNNLKDRTVLVLGAGETAKLTACCFKRSGINKIIISNRSEKRGKYLAESISGDYINMHHINDALCECDIIVTATHAGDYLIKRDQIEKIMKKRKNTLLLFDISTPRNMEPAIRNIDNVILYDIDHLDALASKNSKDINKALAKAEIIIQSYSLDVMKWFNSLRLQEARLVPLEEGA